MLLQGEFSHFFSDFQCFISSIFYLLSYILFLFFFSYFSRDKALIITEEDEVDSESSTGVSQGPVSVPWCSILTSPAFLALIYNHFAQNWGFYIFLSWLPTYLKLVLGFDIKSGKNIWSMVPYIGAAIVTISSGVVASLLIENKVMRTLSM